MNLKEILYKELNENKILKDELGEIVEKITVKTIKSDGGEAVSKQMVLDYMKSMGLQMTQKNYEQASHYLQNKVQENNVDGDIEMKFTEQEYINHLGEFSEDDMKTLIDICILRKLKEIEEKLSGGQLYEYVVESIHDEQGMTNIYKLSELITSYAEKGYYVKSIFANELGKNALSLGGVGVNTTSEQVVIIFERPKIMK